MVYSRKVVVLESSLEISIYPVEHLWACSFKVKHRTFVYGENRKYPGYLFLSANQALVWGLRVLLRDAVINHWDEDDSAKKFFNKNYVNIIWLRQVLHV